jgi:polyphosphate kinase
MSHADYRYFNRELSHLGFHRRVLAMAEDDNVPLLERLRFLCISSSNLDEFFEVRVASILQKMDLNLHGSHADDMDLQYLIEAIRIQAREMLTAQYHLLHHTLLPRLKEEGIRFYRRTHWNDKQRAWLADYMHEQILPVISPLGVDPAHPFPRIANRTLHFIVSLSGRDAFGRNHHYAIVPAPRSLPRVLKLPEEYSDVAHGFVFLSSIMHAFVDELFPGMQVHGCHQFRLTRDTELYLDEEEMADLKLEVKGRLETTRRFGRAVRLEIDEECPEESISYLLEKFQLKKEQCYLCNGPVNLPRLDSVYDQVKRPDLKFKPMIPSMATAFHEDENIFSHLRKQDVLLHHPFESFEPVIKLLESAANDPKVLAIRQTLYRTGDHSRIVAALCRAARHGKDVSAVVELRARFDEQDNIELSERMQRAGVHVVYGVVGFKTHAKMMMVVRREHGKLVRYCHLGTGNYHGITTRFYTDFGLLTTDETIGNDMHLLFQQLTGLGCATRMEKVVQAPFDLHPLLLKLIDREIQIAQNGAGARIIIKVNGLQDPELIEALYRASQAGVRVDLIVRGVCCLRPGVEGMSENIRVRSVLGRFLEHTRIYYFGNHGKALVYASSADGMIRNLKNRVETAFPIENRTLRQRLIREGLRYYLKDNQGAWRLLADGTYKRIHANKRSTPFSAQQKLIDTLAKK